VRRLLVPAPDRARQVLARLKPGTEPLLPALERELAQLTGVSVARPTGRRSGCPTTCG
jgi:ATP-dependent helicase HrpA